MQKANSVLDYSTISEMLSEFEIPYAKGKVVKSAGEAAQAAAEIGFPVVIKLLSPDITHKMDAGAVVVGIKSENEAADAAEKVLASAGKYAPEAKIEGILVQEMVEGGVEVIAGMSKDNLFGPVIVFGLGGIFVEVLKDIVMLIPPVTKETVKNMIKEIKGYKLLEGYRNLPPANIDSLCDILTKLSLLSLKYQDSISQIDLNPIIVDDKGAKVVDMLFIK